MAILAAGVARGTVGEAGAALGGGAYRYAPGKGEIKEYVASHYWSLVKIVGLQER
jgi:alkylation response protein AidB-like acyl-CoA dehydrogenase